MKGLLTPNNLGPDIMSDPEKLREAIPMTVEAWKARLAENIEPRRRKELEPLMDLYDDYFQEWMQKTEEELSRGKDGKVATTRESKDDLGDETRDSVAGLRESVTGDEKSDSTTRSSAFLKLKSKSISMNEVEFESGSASKDGKGMKRAGPQNDGPRGRLTLLSAVLDFS